MAMEHEHIVTEELTSVMKRLNALARHLEGDHERRHWERARAEVDTLLVLVRERINARGGF